MRYNEYGKTGARVSEIGFGGMRFDTKIRSEEENAAILRYAVDKGINYLDTAPKYCEDRSESIFGIAIKQMAQQRDQFYVSTKAMPLEHPTAQSAQEAVENSLKRLQTDKIDFFHVWCIRKMDQYELAMKAGGQYEGLLKCKEQGKIDHIVVSTHLHGSQIETMLSGGHFEGCLMGINVLNFMYRWQGVQAAYNMGLGVVAMNPLGGGLIPDNEDQLGFLAGPGETPTEAAIRFCVGCPQITVALVGLSSREQIDVACRVAEKSRPFTEEDLDRVRRNVSENMDALCTGCGYCMGLCPKEIPIASYMMYYNQRLLNEKSDEQMIEALRFENEWGLLADRKGQAGDCIECGRCQQECTQRLSIIKRLNEIRAWHEKAGSTS